MAHFRFNPNKGSQKGKVSYNPGIVNGIVALAVQEVEGVSLVDNKKSINLQFDNKGSIKVDVTVKVVYGVSVRDAAFNIQQTIKHNVETMTSYRISKVDVLVASVDIRKEA